VSAPVGPLGLPAAVASPSVKLRKRALHAKGRMSLGQVTCAQRCTVQVKVSGGGRKAKTTTFTLTGSRALRVATRHGRLAVRVRVDGKLAATGRVRA
jgi:hypothetical protein